jgi:hypothetical protein
MAHDPEACWLNIEETIAAALARTPRRQISRCKEGWTVQLALARQICKAEKLRRRNVDPHVAMKAAELLLGALDQAGGAESFVTVVTGPHSKLQRATDKMMREHKKARSK